MTETPVRLLALDLDDTLVREGGFIAPEDVQALHCARGAGVIVTIATGRPYPSAARFAAPLDIKSPMIVAMGAAIVEPDGQELWRCTLPESLAVQITRFVNDLGFYIQAHSRDEFLFQVDCEQSRYYARGGQAHRAIGEALYGGLGLDPYKLLCITEPGQGEALGEQIAARFGGSVTLAVSRSRFLEITHPGADKGQALERLCGMLGVPVAQAMAIGDSFNDIPMLRAAGIGVAMGNAAPAVRAAADYVTADIEHFGVRRAVERFILR